MRRARVRVGRADRRERGGRRDARRRQHDVVERDRLAHLAVAGDPQVLLEARRGRAQLRDRPRVVLVAPAPVLAPCASCATIVPPHAYDASSSSPPRSAPATTCPPRSSPPALRERGATADVVDGLELAGPVARAIVGGVSSPDSAPAALAFERRLPARHAPRADARAPARASSTQLVRGRFAAYLRAHPADVVVSTYPLMDRAARAACARTARSRPRSSARSPTSRRCATGRTPAIDLHLVTHPESEPRGARDRRAAARGSRPSTA